MKETVEAFTGIPLDGYLLTGFDGYKAMVDDAGGLSIDVLKALPKLDIASGQPGPRRGEGAEVRPRPLRPARRRLRPLPQPGPRS